LKNGDFYLVEKYFFGNSQTYVKSKGHVNLNANYLFELDVKNHKVENFTLKLFLSDDTEIRLESNYEISVNKEFKVGEFSLGVFVAYIPGTFFPIVVKPEIDIYIGADGTTSLQFDATATQTATFQAGLEYGNSGWQIIKDYDNDFGFNCNLVGEIDLKCYAGTEFEFLLYGISGANTRFQGYLDGKITINHGEIFGGLEVSAGINPRILSKFIPPYSIKLFETKEKLWEYQNYLNADLIVTPNRGTPPLEVLLDASNSEGNITSYIFSFGDNSPNYVESSENCPDGNFDGKIRHSYSNQGNYPCQVTVFDAQHHSDIAKDTVYVEGIPTTITIQPNPSQGKDAYVELNVWSNGDSTFSGDGNSLELEVHNDFWGSPLRGVAKEILIQFPLSSIPTNAIISSATIEFYGSGASSYNYDPIFGINKINSSWNESTVKWNTKPSYGNRISTCTITGETKWYEWDATDLVQDWIDCVQTNYGVSILTTRNSEGGQFKSSDYSDSSKRPKLKVTYFESE